MTGTTIALFIAFLAGMAALLLIPLRRRWVRWLSLVIILLMAFGLRLAWLMKTRSYPISDFYSLYTASYKLFEGYNPFTTPGVVSPWMQNYFNTWPYQNGFVIFQAAVMRLIGTSRVFPMQFVSLLMSTASVGVTYLIGSALTRPRTGLVAAFMYATYMPVIMMSSALTNQTVATLSYLLAFWLLIRGQQLLDDKVAGKLRGWRDYVALYWRAALAGVFFAFGNAMRPLGLLILLAVGVFYVFYRLLFQHNNWGKIVHSLVFLLVICGMYGASMTATNTVITSRGWSPYRLVNRNPLWKLVTGLSSESNGQFSSELGRKVSAVPIGEKRNKVERQIIKDEIKDKKVVLNLFVTKFQYFWGTSDDTAHWTINNPSAAYNDKTWLKKQWLYKGLQGMQWVTIFACFALGLVALLKPWGRPLVASDLGIVFIIMWFAYVSVHLLIEIQLRYRFFITPIVIVVAAVGITALVRALRYRSALGENKENLINKTLARGKHAA